jgi:serine/threonine protein kinase
VIGGRYSLDREIGRGGMGAVWLGRDEVLGRIVAIKRVGHMPGGSSPDLVRAEREARIAARVNSPHVVAVFDLVDEDDQQWLVMEYVEGRTLAELLQDEGPMKPDRAAALLTQVAEALRAAHAAGVVHRDVKPSNILVTADGHVKLSDFGIARAEADASLTQTGQVTGSPAYLAPEVASGRQATAASDVWSLGATLFHALSGRPPYDVGSNVLGALYRIVHEDPPRLENAGWLAPLVESSMTQDASRRWSMAQVADFLGSGPGATPPADRTEVMSVVPPPDDSPTPDHEPARPDRRARRSGGVLPWLVGAAVLALGVMIGLIAYYGNQDSPEPPADDATTPNTTQSPPASTPPATSGANAEDMEAFVTDYLSTASSDPSAGFAMLTPEFQAQSGGLEGYTEFWGTVTNVDLLEVAADADDPDNLTVFYHYTFNQQGAGKLEDDVTLRLVYENGRYLIAEEQ